MLLHLTLDRFKACVLQHVQFGLKLLVLFLDFVKISRLVGISLQKPDDIIIDCLELLIAEALVTQSGISLVGLIHHGLELQLMFQVSSLFLQLVVVVLQHLYQLLKVLDTLLVVQFDCLKTNTEVVGNICHSSQLTVLGSHVVDRV